MVAVNVVAAPTDDEAAWLFTSIQQRFLGMVRGVRGPLPPPVDHIDALWTPTERAQVQRMLAVSAVGSPATVAEQLGQIIASTQADELIVATAMHEHAARLRSYTLLAQAMGCTSASGSTR